MDELRRIAEDVSQTYLQSIKPRPPDFVRALGLKFGFRVQWAQVDGCDGYRVAMMTTQNLAAPDYLSPLIEGSTTLNWEWFIGDVAAVRQFTVQSFKRTPTGEILFSEFRYPLVSATSKVDGGAADAVPTTAPSAPVAPSGAEDQGDPGGIRKIA
jgi:hypothetical protein